VKSARSMVVAGVMSGTSADGVDVALCRIGPGADSPRVRLLGMKSFPYPKAVRAELLAVMAGEARTAANLGRLNWQLGTVLSVRIGTTWRSSWTAMKYGFTEVPVNSVAHCYY